jgi:hypothetical protein
MTSRHFLQSCRAVWPLVLALGAAPAAAHPPAPSQASAASSALSIGLPIAVSVGPALVLSAGVSLTVVAVQATAIGTVWVLQRASDGAQISVQWAASGVAAASVGVGTVLAVTVISTGWLLSAAGEAIAFIPNEIGASLIHHERITY